MLRRIINCLLAGLWLWVGASSSAAQPQPLATPLPPGVSATELSFSHTMENFAANAAQLLPALERFGFGCTA